LPCRRSRVRVPSAALRKALQIGGFFVGRNDVNGRFASLYNNSVQQTASLATLPALAREVPGAPGRDGAKPEIAVTALPHRDAVGTAGFLSL